MTSKTTRTTSGCVRRLIVLATAALATGVIAAPAEASVSPGWSCDASGENCVSNAMEISAFAWSDIDLGCPIHRPYAYEIDAKFSGLEQSLHVIHGPYDTGPGDGGHFWIRLNNTAPWNRRFVVAYECHP